MEKTLDKARFDKVPESLFSILLTEDLIWVNGPYVSEDDKPWIGEEEYNKQISQFKEAEQKVIFKGLHVEYDSDGDEYSHYTWPFQIHGFGEGVEVFYEDEGIYIANDFGMIKFNALQTLSVGEFITALHMLQIDFELSDYGKSYYSLTS